jgi:hypothetical protein
VPLPERVAAKHEVRDHPKHIMLNRMHHWLAGEMKANPIAAMRRIRPCEAHGAAEEAKKTFSRGKINNKIDRIFLGKLPFRP